MTLNLNKNLITNQLITTIRISGQDINFCYNQKFKFSMELKKLSPQLAQ